MQKASDDVASKVWWQVLPWGGMMRPGGGSTVTVPMV
jgi:hypothetical protein